MWVLETSDKIKYLISLLSNEFDVTIVDVQFYWLVLGELKYQCW